ncbi:MAG TPA: phage tail sheath subtilisin-like domain-containing protein [Pyrinomonadaceae bacterium]|jgi:hypothetical protein
MAEMILPGTYIEVRAEGLIVPGRVSVGNLGVVGTASNGPIGVPVILGSYSEARERFGEYDAFIDGSSDELTLVRALELAFSEGATTVFAVRVAQGLPLTPTQIGNLSASYMIRSAGADNVNLIAKNPGTLGNDLEINITAADQDAFIDKEEFTGGGPFTLANAPVKASARNRIRLATINGTRSLTIIYDTAGDPGPGRVNIDTATGDLTLDAALDPADTLGLTASYVVDRGSAVKVTLRRGTTDEVYTVVSGNDLAGEINREPGGSALARAIPQGGAASLPDLSPSASDFAPFGVGPGNTVGDNGAAATASDYKFGLDLLLNEPAHIMVAAGQDDSFGDELNAHCQQASTDVVKGDRIGVVGSRLGATLDSIRGHNLDSDRLIFVAPGIKANDAASGKEVTLPGAYTAAAVAGLLAALPAHNSPTNKILSVGGLEQRYTSAELTQLVQNRVLAVEQRQGFRIVKGITTSTNTAFAQITTRRIVDFAKFGVRSASISFIGKLNNERVRTALRGAINSFLGEMVDDEMLISYDLEVSATRAEEIKGIVRVTMVLRPTFSIDFIKVTMFLE